MMAVAPEEQPMLSDRAAARLVCQRFSDHWKATEGRQAGGEDVAVEEAPCFLGGSLGARLRHARRFYSVAHTEQMAALTDPETAAQLSELLPRLVECAGDPLVARRRGEQERFLGEVLTPLERRSAMAGIRRDILGQARVEDAETDWRLEFDDGSPPDRVECEVWFELEVDAYADDDEE